MEGPAEGREPPPAKVEAKAKTRKQKPLFIGGIRCCPRCMTGGPRGKGGKHYSHDREAGGLRATWQRGTRRDGTQNPQGRRRELRVGEGNQGHPRAPPSGQETAGHSDKAYQNSCASRQTQAPPEDQTGEGDKGATRYHDYLQKQGSPATESSKAEHQAEETDNTAVVVLKLKLVEHHPRRHRTTRTTSQRPRRPRQRRPAKQRGSDPGRGLARHPQLPAPGRQDEEAQQEKKEARGKVERHKGRDSRSTHLDEEEKPKEWTPEAWEQRLP